MTDTYPDESDGDSSARRATKPKPFPFFTLPSELRVRVYELVLTIPETVDLDPLNFRNIARRLTIFSVSHRVYEEAYRVFYGSNTFRLFPIHGRFFNTKKPLLTRMPAKYRAEISKIELRLGPGFTAPPNCWDLGPKLGLEDLQSVRLLKVLVELDPASSDVFEGFRKSKDFYTEFCLNLLGGLFEQVGSIQAVEFDAFPAVSRDSPLMQALLNASRSAKKTVSWGPERGWRTTPDTASAVLDLGQSLSTLSVGDKFITVH